METAGLTTGRFPGRSNYPLFDRQYKPKPAYYQVVGTKTKQPQAQGLLTQTTACLSQSSENYQWLKKSATASATWLQPRVPDPGNLLWLIFIQTSTRLMPPMLPGSYWQSGS